MDKLTSSKFWWLYLLIAIVGANFIAAQFHYRIDLTKEKRYTLSEPTKKLLKNLDGDVNVDVYLKGDLKAGIKKLAKGTEELLQEFQEYSNGKIHFRFFDPLTSLDDSAKQALVDSLNKMGIQQMTQVAQSKKGEEQSERFVLPGAVIKYKERIFPVNLLKGASNTDENALYNNAEALLEYKFANAIDKVTQKHVPAIAYVLGNGEPLDFSVYNLIEGLRKNYNFGIFRLDSVPTVPQQFSAVIIVKPNNKFTDAEKLKLDQYAMHGGNIIFMIDNLRAEMDSLKADQETIAYDRGLNLDDLLFKYGARINQDLVQDMQCASLNFVVGMQGDKPQMQLLQWPYFPLLNGSLTSPISKNLDPVYAKFTNSVDTVKANGIKKTVLLQTSANGRIIGTPAIISFESVKVANDPKVFNRPYIPAAVLLEGKFHSLFANRISSGMADTLANIYKEPFLPIAEKESKIIVCGSAEIFMNDVAQRGPLPMGYNKDINYTFANQDFAQNCIDYLTSNSGILETRAKDFTLRLLDPKKVDDERTLWQFINVVVPLLLVIIAGFVYQLIRKKKYTE
ncbi:MAG: gliding motility-associated ABC transporter substrate-binding protein GldG [Bacteroidetes bacterium]|nr:gliding motility-associated ABC transporter substrate-binding protein GldG [Bacteroidota bacterium]MBS1974204.1 gliding motility-associated ABC transporter substrate-binding protein GldG [Bacteroidota bacterium]